MNQSGNIKDLSSDQRDTFLSLAVQTGAKFAGTAIQVIAAEVDDPQTTAQSGASGGVIGKENGVEREQNCKRFCKRCPSSGTVIHLTH